MKKPAEIGDQILEALTSRLIAAVLDAGLFPDSITAGAWARFRQALLRESQALEHLEEVLNVWKRHLESLVPKPASALKAEYAEHARWMKGLLELNPSGYQRVLNDWRAKHSRRRNLWQEMRDQGLPA